MSNPYFIHPTSSIGDCKIGRGTRIWQYVVILDGATIGEYCNICSHVFIEGQVVIGNGVTIKNGAMIWNGVSIEDNVFIGPNVTFTNDRHPRSNNRDFSLEPTRVLEGASIGAGAVLLPGITVGRRSMVGAGSVVTGNIEDFSIYAGNPARKIGFVGD